MDTNKWISVFKKLPEIGGNYLITEIDLQGSVYYEVATAFFSNDMSTDMDGGYDKGEKGWIYFDGTGNNPVDITSSVIAWMNLPEPFNLYDDMASVYKSKEN